MAYTIDSSNSIFNSIGGHAIWPLMGQSDLHVASSGQVVSGGVNSKGFFLSDLSSSGPTSYNLVIDGLVSAYTSGQNNPSIGIDVNRGFDGVTATIAVGETGIVQGSIGINVGAGCTASITNSGLIRGTNGAGVSYEGSGFTLRNYATAIISSTDTAVYWNGAATTTINNSGKILGGSYGILSQGTGRDVTINSGLINHDVYLTGSGNDLVNTVAGRIVGTTSLYEGADTFLGSNVYSDNVRGGAGDDILNGYGGRDTIYGEAGDDDIAGGTNGDTLYGGTDDDAFIYSHLLHSGMTATSADRIMDFDDNGFDYIDLTNLATGTSSTAFTYQGTSAFTGAGQVRIAASGTDVMVYINVDADLSSEMSIRLVNTTLAMVTIGDFDLI